MPLFRRSPETVTPEVDASDPATDRPVPAAQQGKGRPTPKRRDAEAARRAKPPQNRKEARARMREEKAKERADLMVALREGDERRYPPRDRGPARHIARNWVDGRRGVGDYFWPAVIAAIVMIVLPVPQIQAWSSVLLIGFYLVLMADTTWSLTGLNKVLKEKVPEAAQRKGALPYAFGRSLQSRKRRLPAVQVERGWTKQARRGEIDPLK